jgi:exonuclease III
MKIDGWITKYSQEPDNIIIVGDFNCKLEKTDIHSANVFQKLIKNNNLTDLWLDIRPQDPWYTWCNGANLPTSRIDYMFLYQIHSSIKLKIFFSEKYQDHIPGQFSTVDFNSI